MAMTLSFQNGSTYCFKHNDRAPELVAKEAHIDPNGEHETWYKESLQDAYKRLFGDALAEYNARQKRPERRIEDYLTHVRQDKKKHDCYECIVQIGSKDSLCDPKIGKKILKQFVADWPERNPTLAIVGAYYHADEQGAPHVHIDYVPCAVGYRNGMSKQNGLEKALWNINPDLYKCHEKQGKQGVYTTGQMVWQQHERDVLEELCTEHGIHITRGTDTHAKHKSVDLYKRERAVEAREADLDAREQRLMQLETTADKITKEINKSFPDIMTTAALKKEKKTLSASSWDWLVDRYTEMKNALVAVLCHREWRKTIASIKVDTNIHDNGRSR